MCPSNNITGTIAIDLEKLRHECPGATPNERKRFLDAKDGNYKNALDQLKKYLAWRTEHGLDDVYHCSSKMIPKEDSCDCDCDFGNVNANANVNANDDSDDDHTTLASTWSDEEIQNKTNNNEDIWHSCASDEESLDKLDWRFASQAALWYERSSTHSNKKPAATSTSTTMTLPQLASILPPPRKASSRQHVPMDQTGHRILHLLPAKMDLSVASDTAFALAIALYLERKLDRDSPETMTVAIDVRGGDGWANPRPQKLLPFIQQVAGLLEQNFPERLANCVVFPIPAIGTMIWKMARVFLDPSTAEKIHLVRGDARNSAPAPFGAMEEHVSRSVLAHMEELRCSSFVGDGVNVARFEQSPKTMKKKKQQPPPQQQSQQCYYVKSFTIL
jgi:hypothetical protein